MNSHRRAVRTACLAVLVTVLSATTAYAGSDAGSGTSGSAKPDPRLAKARKALVAADKLDLRVDDLRAQSAEAYDEALALRFEAVTSGSGEEAGSSDARAPREDSSDDSSTDGGGSGSTDGGACSEARTDSTECGGSLNEQAEQLEADGAALAAKARTAAQKAASQRASATKLLRKAGLSKVTRQLGKAKSLRASAQETLDEIGPLREDALDSGQTYDEVADQIADLESSAGADDDKADRCEAQALKLLAKAAKQSKPKA